jgi:signal transduction histidine kinase
MKGTRRKIGELQTLSSGSKIGVQVMWLVILVIIPSLFPGLIKIQNPTLLTVNILLALFTSIFYEVLKTRYEKQGKNTQLILNLQLLTSVILLTWFLHLFGRINGPFFVLYLLTVMESALNLSVKFPNIVVAIAGVSTVVEFFWLVNVGEIFISLYTGLQLFVRLVSLLFIRSYGISLAQKFISEQESRDKVQSYAKSLEETRAKLQGLNDKLRELDKQKDEFVSMAAHELRSPLTAIKGYLSMVVEGDTGDIPEKAREYLADAMAVTERLVRLVNNMLNVSRIEEGRIVYQMEETSLIRALQEVYNSSRVEAERKNLNFKLSIPNGTGDIIKADPDRLREVIGNLVSNAIKFTDEGEVVISMTNPKPNIVKVEIIDTGPGISEEEQKKLFQKFYRAESTAGKTFGTGLGLYITRLLIEKFGGKIHLASEIDKGSNFWFELPLVKSV